MMIERILDLARWAPSGDNSQPWRVEIVDARRFTVHGFDTRTHCVYDLDGHASQLSIGAFIETAAIAASAYGLALEVALRQGIAETTPTFDVNLRADATVAASPLITAIPRRSVQRRPLAVRRIEPALLAALEQSVGPEHELVWFAAPRERVAWTRLLWTNAGLRLRLPEAFETHRSIIQWRSRFSVDRVPDQALGASGATLILMRLGLESWERVDFLNRWLGGTIIPRIEMDVIPALACGAHLAILQKRAPTGISDYVSAGRAVQRFWLTATRLGLQHQPALTPLVFARYVRERRTFTSMPHLLRTAVQVGETLERLLDGRTERAVWLGRLGHGQPAVARSERLTLAELMHNVALD